MITILDERDKNELDNKIQKIEISADGLIKQAVQSADRAENSANTARSAVSAVLGAAQDAEAAKNLAKEYRDQAAAIITPDGLTAQIIKNADNIISIKDNYIKVSSTQPSSTDNKMWVNPNTDRVAVPTAEAFETLKKAESGLSESIYGLTGNPMKRIPKDDWTSRDIVSTTGILSTSITIQYCNTLNLIPIFVYYDIILIAPDDINTYIYYYATKDETSFIQRERIDGSSILHIPDGATYIRISCRFNQSIHPGAPADFDYIAQNVSLDTKIERLEEFRKEFKDEININSFTFHGNIVDGDNIDTFDQPGIWFCPSTAAVEIPTRNSYLIVYKGRNTGTSGRCVQMAISSGTPNHIFLRTADTNLNWRKWTQLADVSMIKSGDPAPTQYMDYQILPEEITIGQDDYNGHRYSLAVRGKQYLYVATLYHDKLPYHIVKLDISRADKPLIVSCNVLHINGTALNEILDTSQSKMNIVDMIYRNNYLYCAVRGGSGEPANISETNGYILTIDCNTMTVVDAKASHERVSTVSIHENYLAVGEQLGGWSLYSISNPAQPTVIGQYLRSSQESFGEWQQSDWYEADGKTYVAFGGYTRGVRIYEVTPSGATLAAHWDGLGSIANNINTFAVCCKYPYLYATVSPLNKSGLNSKKRGIVTLNVSDLNNITSQYCQIPDRDQGNWCARGVWDADAGKMTLMGVADPSPAFCKIYDDKVLTTNEDKGIAVFTLEDATVIFDHNILINDWIKAFDIDEDGFIYASGLLNYVRQQPNRVHMLRFI